MVENNQMKLLMLVKDLNIKTLNTGDKSARITFETLYPQDITQLKDLADETEVIVQIDKPNPKA